MDKLLGLLQENARLSCEQMAVMLGKTADEVRAQIAQYEKDGVIRGYHALINWEKADANRASALIELRVTPKPDKGLTRSPTRLCSLKRWRAFISCPAALIWRCASTPDPCRISRSLWPSGWLRSIPYCPRHAFHSDPL